LLQSLARVADACTLLRTDPLGGYLRLLRNSTHRISAIALLVTAYQAGCRFEPDLSPLVIPTAPEPAIGGPVSSDSDLDESPEAGVERLLDELFDPYNLPLDRPYIGSAYEAADQVLAGAYAYYGYDLAELAASGQDNPLSLGDFKNYLELTGQRLIEDPVTGEDFDVYIWLANDRGISGAADLPSRVLDNIPGLDSNYSMNYERNYLAALYAAHPQLVAEARQGFQDHVRGVYGDDAAAQYRYLLSLDLMGTAGD